MDPSQSQEPLTRAPSSGSLREPRADPQPAPTQSETRIIDIKEPKVIHISKEDFKEVVQRLTGYQPPSSKATQNNNNAANVSDSSAARMNAETQIRPNKRSRIDGREMQIDRFILPPNSRVPVAPLSSFPPLPILGSFSQGVCPTMKNQATGGGYGIFQFNPSLGSSNYSDLLMPSGTLPPRSNSMASVAPTSSIPPLPSEQNSRSNFPRGVSPTMKIQAKGGGIFQFDSISGTSNYSNLLMSTGPESMAPGTSFFPPVSTEPNLISDDFFDSPSPIMNQGDGNVGSRDSSYSIMSPGSESLAPGAPTNLFSPLSSEPNAISDDLFDGVSPTMNQANSSGGGAGGIFQSDLSSWSSHLLDWLMSSSSSSPPLTSQSCHLFNGNNLHGSEEKK